MLFQELFESFDIDKQDPLNIYPNFKVRVIAVGTLAPTDPMFDYYLEPTRALVQRLFAGTSLGRTAVHPTFVFPERWMSPQQIQKFMQTLHECNDSTSKRIKVVDIITGSAVIITDFTSDMVRVLA